eukprot:CAMPEP_0201477746 /NCGR_PEP_ID=MMETSP0151_2-20130828/2717_1 /ASSEMBLY_ACC=CAM_ASM_000257 /TAXON_ID=200890 /ORGANISM="Paramoeba atlantica, Strain 621/1 / CCAP 1560/9" /LENGTH=784 /DNA_ID=CAMNT_0047858573 /DNA_START=230 /DNA_END=2584 /DNA_ORIENTATION=+
MAFCALLHKFHPDLIDYASLDPKDIKGNLKLSFEVGSKVGIPILLEVDEVSEANEAAMLAYIAKYYWVFKDRTGSRVKLKASSSTVSPSGPVTPASSSSSSSSSPSSSSSSSSPSSSSPSSSSPSPSPSSSEKETPSSSDSETRSRRADKSPQRATRDRPASKKLVGHLVPKVDTEYSEAIESMIKHIQTSIVPSTEEHLASLFDGKKITLEIKYDTFTASLPKISEGEQQEKASSPGARQAWRAVRSLHVENGKLVIGTIVSVVEQFLSGHPDLGKDIPERSFNKVVIENIPLPPETSLGDDDETDEKPSEEEKEVSPPSLVIEKRDTYIKDGVWVIQAPFALKTPNCGPFTRNELLVILLDLFGIVNGSENTPGGEEKKKEGGEENKSEEKDGEKKGGNAEAKIAFQTKEWRQTRSLREMVVRPTPGSSQGGEGEPLNLGEEGGEDGSGWQEGKAKSQLGELVWMEISIPAIARQLRVQYPLSTTIGQIKNYLKTQFAEEMQNLYALYAYELCHLRSVTSGGDDVWLLYPDSNLYTYNIQNNDVLEFAMDEEQVQERKPIELEGYLQKEGQKGLMKLWKHRWFSTQDNRLLYFHSETSTDPVGFIPLTQIVSIGTSTNPAHANMRAVFEIKTTQRVYYLLAECEEDKETWIAGMTNSMTYWKSNSMQWTQQWKEGFLVKRGGIRHNWLKRWFMLRDEFLFYYEAKDGSHYLRGKIPLYGVTVEEVDKKKSPNQSHQFFFNVSTSGRVFQLAAEAEEERKAWIRAIQLQGQLFSSRIDAITES